MLPSAAALLLSLATPVDSASTFGDLRACESRMLEAEAAPVPSGTPAEHTAADDFDEDELGMPEWVHLARPRGEPFPFKGKALSRKDAPSHDVPRRPPR